MVSRELALQREYEEKGHKIFLWEINPNMSGAALQSEVKPLVRDEVFYAEVQVHEEGEQKVRKGTGVVHFATWNAAARAQTALKGPPIARIGGRALHSVENGVERHKKRELADAGSKMCLAIALCVGIPLLIFLKSGLSLTTEQPMVAFTEQTMLYFDAGVLSSGVSYNCAGFWGGPPSTDCVNDERACLGIADQLHPTSADVAAVEHMHDSRHNASRELAVTQTCNRVVTPWLKVILYDGAEEKVRCAYKYGTRPNTKFMKMSSILDAKAFIAAHPVGSKLRVWSLPTPHRCLVGFADVTDLATTTKDRTKWVFIAIELCFLGFGSFCLVNLWRHKRAQAIPDNPPPEDEADGHPALL